MKRKLLLLSYVAAGAVALAAPMSKATPLASPPRFDNGVAQAHAVRICDDDGDCWWSSRHRHGGDWDEDRDRGWRHGYRDYEDRYGRAPDSWRDWSDRDYGRRGERDYERHGRSWDGDRDRGEWGRSPERERHGMDDKDKDKDRERSARDESPRDRDKDWRADADQGVKERGDESGAQTEKKQ